MSNRIPPLLEPYLTLPPDASLILLTNVLGATSNWLILRFLYSTLNAKQEKHDGIEDVKVVFVSFLRDLSFWKEGGKRLVSSRFVVYEKAGGVLGACEI